MKLLLVHNEYGRHSGEETIFEATVDLLRARGHTVETFVRSSRTLAPGLSGQVKGFVHGIWSHRSRVEFAAACDAFRPDVVHVQNLYPLISPSILGIIARRGLPLVYACHNYRLFCPTGLMLRDGAICTRCATASFWSCVRFRCEGNLPRSAGYAIRNAVARPRLLAGVHQFIVLSSFQAERFAEWGVPRDRISVVPNFIQSDRFPLSASLPGSGDYVGFAGRLSPEKGLGVLAEVARRLPHVRFEVAGHAERLPDIGVHPTNLALRGELPRSKLPDFYRRARFLVVPSVWFESFGMVVLEAMVQERAVIASRIGGLADIVVADGTGVLLPPGDVAAWTTGIDALWRTPATGDRLGRAARRRIQCEYTPDRFYERLMAAYSRAVETARGISGEAPAGRPTLSPRLNGQPSA